MILIKNRILLQPLLNCKHVITRLQLTRKPICVPCADDQSPICRFHIYGSLVTAIDRLPSLKQETGIPSQATLYKPQIRMNVMLEKQIPAKSNESEE